MTKTIFRFYCLSACCLIRLSSPSFGQSAAPKILPFQGRLADRNGAAVTDGAKLVQFKIYSVPADGIPVWNGEVHRTTVNGGLVNVMLGTKTLLEGVDFNQQLYLEITVDVSGPGGLPDDLITEADPPMLPRQAILPVVFAKETAMARDSQKLAGKDWSSIPNGAISSNQIALGGISISNLVAEVAQALCPPGTIVAFGGAAAEVPKGWLMCNGAPVSTNAYPALWAAIGTAWGSGFSPGTGSPISFKTFNLPDLRGMFLRGVDGGRGKDPESTKRVNYRFGSNGSTNVGSFQPDSLQEHKHNSDGSGFANNAPGGLRDGGIYVNVSLTTGGINIADGARVSAETRPMNVYVNYIIKY